MLCHNRIWDVQYSETPDIFTVAITKQVSLYLSNYISMEKTNQQENWFLLPVCLESLISPFCVCFVWLHSGFVPRLFQAHTTCFHFLLLISNLSNVNGINTKIFFFLCSLAIIAHQHHGSICPPTFNLALHQSTAHCRLLQGLFKFNSSVSIKSKTTHN